MCKSKEMLSITVSDQLYISVENTYVAKLANSIDQARNNIIQCLIIMEAMPCVDVKIIIN